MSEAAIRLSGVGKRYSIYPSRVDRVLDAFGVARFLPARRAQFRDLWALRGVDLEVARGGRLGIIGRNGAGKTTLLKVVAGMAPPTEGRVTVDGKVQALLDVGAGFHPEFTGMENIHAALTYQGVEPGAIGSAAEEIAAFTELGQFLGQPFKTYSAGMQARLTFATATAVRPEILIVDEILGAGDAYFFAKSTERMLGLVTGGATVIIVSHALNQIVRFCDDAVWLDRGAVVMRGEPLAVVKAYEEFSRRLDEERMLARNREPLLPDRPDPAPTDGHRAVTRWPGERSLVIRRVAILGPGGERAVFGPGEPLTLEVELEAAVDGDFPVIPTATFHRLDGILVTNHVGPETVRSVRSGDRLGYRLDLGPLLLGDGQYVATVAFYRRLSADGGSRAYDLLDRSFEFRVSGAGSFENGIIRHPGAWRASDGSG
jgi:lipopolysaccharide transport system ATP-binding protein